MYSEAVCGWLASNSHESYQLSVLFCRLNLDIGRARTKRKVPIKGPQVCGIRCGRSCSADIVAVGNAANHNILGSLIREEIEEEEEEGRSKTVTKDFWAYIQDLAVWLSIIASAIQTFDYPRFATVWALLFYYLAIMRDFLWRY